MKRLLLLLPLLFLGCADSVIIEAQGKLIGAEGITTFVLNGDTVAERRNVVTDTCLDEMCRALCTGNFSKVQKYGIAHKWPDLETTVIWYDTVWVSCVYYAGGYDTCNYTQWVYNYWTDPNVAWDTVYMFFLAYGTESKVYAIQDTSFGLIGNDMLTIYWKFLWTD